MAFLEPDLNAHNPLSVFNTKTPRERASECPPDHHYTFDHYPIIIHSVLKYVFFFLVLSMPDTVEEMCPEMPRLDRLLKDVNDVSESGARYSDVPQV